MLPWRWPSPWSHTLSRTLSDRQTHFAIAPALQMSFDVHANSSVLMPGDTLITTCTYNSTFRTSTTNFGLATSDEMCYNFILYYPAYSGLSQCISQNRTGAQKGTRGLAGHGSGRVFSVPSPPLCVEEGCASPALPYPPPPAWRHTFPLLFLLHPPSRPFLRCPASFPCPLSPLPPHTPSLCFTLPPPSPVQATQAATTARL